MEPLELSTRSLFVFDSTPESPVVEGGNGIRIVAENLAFADGQLSLDVLATYEFEPAFAAAFQRLDDAPVLGIEDAETGAVAAVPLIDPRKKFPPRSGPNFRGIRPWPRNKIGLTGGSVIMPLDISVARPLLEGPSLYLTMFLQRHISNTLAVDLGAMAAKSYLAGELFEPPREGPEVEDGDADTEEDDSHQAAAPVASLVPRRRALAAALRSPGPFRRGTPILLDIMVTLTPDELGSVGALAWLRSLFLWSSAQSSQATGVCNLLGEKTVFPDDFRSVVIDGIPYQVADLTVDLTSLLGLGSSPGVDYVYVSARHHRAEALEVECL